jgi:Lar family restriction alleviation protein
MSDLNEQLLPCPFCGGADHHIETMSVQPDDFHDAHVECGTCEAHGRRAYSLEGWLSSKDEAKAEAVIAWNRRAPAAAPAPVAAISDAIAAYRPGTWFDARTIDEMQAFYMSRLPAIREAAKEHGYAIGLHGSARRDFDLLAMPWREGAADRDTLAHAIADAACGILREGAYDWEAKPAGRVATSIPICWTAHDNPDFDGMISAGHIDLSLIDAALAAVPAAATIVQAEPVAWACPLNERHETMEKPDVAWGAECDWDEQYKPFPLYAAPTASTADAKDAASMRGHREPFYLMANCRRLLTHPRWKAAPNWVIAMELFATGSTSAWEICREAGIDGDAKTVERAAIATSADEVKS